MAALLIPLSAKAARKARPMSHYDLILKNGTVATPGAIEVMDIAVKDGKIELLEPVFFEKGSIFRRSPLWPYSMQTRRVFCALKDH